MSKLWMCRLNPCYNGIKMKGFYAMKGALLPWGLNPCYNGIKMKV